MRYIIKRLVGTVRVLLRLLGLGAIGSIALAGLVALRHMLLTPQPLDSPLPGEAHLYRWKHGYIYYKVVGEAHTPPILLLHTPELAGSTYEMLGIMAPLAARYRVYAPDLLGFGLSDRPDISYSADLYTELLHDFLADVVKEPATIVASRLACNYAVSVAANSPALCARLVLLSPTALYGYQAGTFRLPSALSASIIIPRQVQMLFYPLLVAITRLAGRLGYDQAPRLLEPPAGAATSNPPPDYTYATTHQFGAEHAPMDWLAGNLASNVSADMQKLRQPTLLIWGTGELQYARQGHAARGSLALEEAEIGGATTRIVLLQRTPSMIHRELPETVVKTILQWSTEPAIAEAKTSTSHNLNETGDATAAPDTTVNESHITIKPQIEAYCMKCKQKRGILNPREVTMKNGRIAVQGDCEVCGASLFRMGRLVPGSPQTPI
ncbi:MAG TPA: alpha/beta fold hydrolase [Ktedonobacteraceae bacterium]